MKVILKQDVKGQGKAGELVNVSDGYARNYLFPRALAMPADAAAMNELKNREEAAKFHKEMEKKTAEELAKRLKNTSVKLSARAGQNGKLFGSVTSKEVAEALQSQFGIELDRRKIEMEDLKAYGVYTATVKLAQGISAQVQVEVNE